MKILDLGTMPFQAAFEEQKRVLDEVVGGAEDTLILVEHPPVLSLGANFHERNLLLQTEEYEAQGIEVVPSDRGGDVTFHGPGQLVIYPIFELKKRGQDLHKWLRDLEQAIIDVLADFEVEGYRFPPNTGVWVKTSSQTEKKIAAIGIKVKKWVSHHGIALNCDNDLGVFDLFVPCGIPDYGVTSLSQATGREVSVAQVKPVVTAVFARL